MDIKIFRTKTALEKEWKVLLKKEEKFLKSREEKKKNILNRTLEEKVPEKLQETLNTAFYKAFALIFEKGTGIIEKTYHRKEIEAICTVNQNAVEEKENRKNLRAFSKKAEAAGTKNLLLSGISGIGLGLAGAGLPDIPLFTAMMLKNIYEIALNYGYEYCSQKEHYFILLLIEGAVSYSEDLKRINEEVNQYIEKEELPFQYNHKEQLQKAANALSSELLYMKFLQGIPIAGVIGGASDMVYMQKITEYANLKYRRRFLEERKRTSNFW